MNSNTHYQPKISNYFDIPPTTRNLPPTGDEIPEEIDDSTIRFAFQNAHGVSTNHGLSVSAEIEAMGQWNISVLGLAETNRPWTAKQRHEYDFMMSSHFHSSRTLYTAAPAQSHDTTYQPGGNLMAINGRTTGRIYDYGADSMGRFCWYALRGKRDEGVLVIVAYRVCHKASDNPGPFTAFQQQYASLQKAGIAHPNPRKQILDDMTSLITQKRAEGLRPILMMDANGDYRNGKDTELRDFINLNNLCDPFYDKFEISPATFIYGTKRIDYILTDPALAGAITRIGYLGTHEGTHSDHVMAVMDMDERKLFAGLINRPPPRHSREILIAQEDKVQAFLHTTKSLLKEHEIQRRVFDLAAEFVQNGASIENVENFQKLYGEFLRLVKAAAKKEGRKKYGYARSPALVLAAQLKCAYKMMLDCKQRRVGASPGLIRYCTKLELDADSIITTHTESELRKLVRKLGRDLWECQKAAESERVEGLQKAAQRKACIEGITDWESKMNAMIATTKTNAVNRKLSMITKGRRGVLDRIQLPVHEWLYSPSKRELYHYDEGVFEAYPASEDGTFHRHHTLKVPSSDVVLVLIGIDECTQRWKITATLPTPKSMWYDVTSQTDIEQALLRRNKRHLQQTAKEEGISTRPPLTHLRENFGLNPMTRMILQGDTITDYETTPEMEAFFRALKRSPADEKLPPILGEFTSDDIRAMFKAAKERTSSDHRTLNYTLWKCMATDDTIAGILSVMFTLPFSYGFVNEYWTSITDFMLEKKPGVRQIHTLRIIGKVAAEFNTCLKYLIGKKARDNFEASAASDEQHGFRPNRSSIDAVWLKLLTFESARMQRCTMATIQHDMTAHFDRMHPSTSAITASKYGVDKNIILCINRTIVRLKRNVETALGVSDEHYTQLPDEPTIGGMVQGKADVPQWSTQQSDAMLKAHESLVSGIHIHSPNMEREIQHSSIAFADDTDGQESCPTEEDDAMLKVIQQLRHSAQTWSNIVQICGGLIALHKCNWQLIAWEISAGRIRMVSSTTEQMSMNDGKGSEATIEYLPPDQPNVGLGYRICPDGSQTHHFQTTLEAVTDLCRKAEGAYLTESEARQLLTQRLIPKVSYALKASSFSAGECRKLNTQIRRTFLPITRLNRHFPGAVLYGPTNYGGLEFPEMYTLQDQLQMDYIVKQLRWDKVVANDFLVTLDSVQLCSGLTEPIMEYPTPTIGYLEKSIIIDLRSRLEEMGASLWVEKAWTPALQRLGDMSIMERFLGLPGVSRSQLRQANVARLYLRVITIADLCDPTGQFIPSGMLSGDWQAGSNLKWPFQPCPPKSYFAVFRRLLRLGFCTKTPIHHHHTDSMDLDQPLGKWLPTPRNVWFPVYRTENELYWRVKDDWDLHVLTKSTTSGFYHYSHTTRELPIHSHPINYQQIGETIWTQRPYRIQQTGEGELLPPGHTVENTISDPASETLTIGSDGSVYLKDEVATCAWMIADSEESRVTACFLLTNISSLSSYRSELEGIYRSLYHVQYLGMTPSEIQHWCDNESAVNDCNRPLFSPSAMGKPDADLLLAIHHLRTIMEDRIRITCRHIYGHQDTRTRDTPRVFHDEVQNREEEEASNGQDFFSPLEEFDHHPHVDQHPTRPLSIVSNIEADRLASETATLALRDYNDDLPPTLQPPYAGSRAMIRIGQTWITSKLPDHIHNARNARILRNYCLNKYKWSESTFDLVDWRNIGRARKKCSKTELVQTSKIMHDWLPVMHMIGHITGLTQCPTCTTADETLDHLFHCTHPAIVRARKDALARTMKKGKDLHIPHIFMETLCGLLGAYFDGGTYTTQRRCKRLNEAIQTQVTIGLKFLPRGLLSIHWLRALEALHCEHADRKLASITYFLWIEVTNSIWKARNEVVHHSNNLTRQVDESRLDRLLLWYKHNRQEALSRLDYRLVSYDVDTLHTLTLASKRERVRQLDIAKTSYELEQKLRDQGQQMITRYFISTNLASDSNSQTEVTATDHQ